MFKRVNKMTSLLVVAAAVISIMPTGVRASTTGSVKSQKGQIYNAIAYKDGKDYISGKPKDKEDAAYYLSDGKYSKLKDIDSEDKAEVYGTKYVEVKDGDYYVDLSTGKVSDEQIKVKDLDAAAVDLRSKVKYDNNGRYDDDDAKSVKDLTEIPNSKFGESYYATEYKVKAVDATVNGGASKFTIYTNKDGKYIDADYNLGKIKVKLSNGKTATIENTSDKDEEVSAKVTDSKVIGQDSNNIYRLATITVKSGASGITISEVNGVKIGNDATSLIASEDKASISFNVIQVISKAQASKEVDGIKYAKNVCNYVLSDKDGKKISLLSEEQKAFTVVNGKIINYKIDGNSLEAEAINLKNKSSIYYIEIKNNDHTTLQDGENSVDIDSEGNLWALSDDCIYKFDNDQDFEKIYSLDKEYTNLSVYDKDNMVVWNADDEIYSIIGKNADKTTDDTTKDETTNANTTTTNNTNATATIASSTATITSGWEKASNGSWSYNNADGTKFKGWLNSGGTWYYLENDGVMATGWKKVDNNWYYLESSGIMKTGWLNDNGTWYYLNTSGEMLSNTKIDGCKLGANGVWIK